MLNYNFFQFHFYYNNIQQDKLELLNKYLLPLLKIIKYQCHNDKIIQETKYSDLFWFCDSSFINSPVLWFICWMITCLIWSNLISSSCFWIINIIKLFGYFLDFVNLNWFHIQQIIISMLFRRHYRFKSWNNFLHIRASIWFIFPTF